MNIKSFASAALLAGTVLTMTACSKDPIEKLSSEESRLYITNRDNTVNFSSYKTFSISDSVAIISNNQLKQKTRDQFDQQLIASISAAMTARGYSQVGKNQTPDIGINVNNIINTYTGYVDYGNYYNDYYGYLDPFYWGYGGYGYSGSYIGTYQVNEGLISIDMFDLKNAPATGKIASIWNGLVRGSGIFGDVSIDGSVKALFDQSTYLKANP
ncbi:MAG: DUF4136 domain-containing protein [Gemmatimonadaceae bacterium]|nr:DUF4136 domain-containing protein [Chitinophagaceae bacterium]